MFSDNYQFTLRDIAKRVLSYSFYRTWYDKLSHLIESPKCLSSNFNYTLRYVNFLQLCKIEESVGVNRFKC